MVPRKMVPLGDDELEGVSGGVIGFSVVPQADPFKYLDDHNGQVLERSSGTTSSKEYPKPYPKA